MTSTPVASGTGSAPVAGLGLYALHIDSDSQTIELTSLRRASALGDAYTLDLSDAFTTAAFGCADCLKVSGFDFATVNGAPYLNLELTARHPFPAATVTTRSDLHLNNVRTVLLLNGNENFFGDAGEPAVAGDVSTISNADGYTVLATSFLPLPAGTTANLFPFHVFETGVNGGNEFPTGNFDPLNGWNDNRLAPTGYNVLPMGGSASTVLQFRMDPANGLEIDTQIALLGNFTVSAASKSQRLTPVYFMPEGAMPEAWRVRAAPPADFAGTLGVAELRSMRVTVWDWQYQATVDAGYPNTANLDGLSAPGDILDVMLDVPEFNAGAVTGIGAQIMGSGLGNDPVLIDVPVNKPPSVGNFDTRGLLKITDARGTQTALKGDLLTPISRVDLATYQVVPLKGPGRWSSYTLNPATPDGCSTLVHQGVVYVATGHALPLVPVMLYRSLVAVPTQASDWAAPMQMDAEGSVPVLGVVNSCPALVWTGIDPGNLQLRQEVALATVGSPVTLGQWNFHAMQGGQWLTQFDTYPLSLSGPNGRLMLTYSGDGVNHLSRATTATPAGPGDYVDFAFAASLQDTQVVEHQGGLALSQVQGGTQLRYGRSTSLAPTSPGNFTMHDVSLQSANSIFPDSLFFPQAQLRIAGGQPVIVFATRVDFGPAPLSNRLMLAQANSPLPGASQDWTVSVIDSTDFSAQWVRTAIVENRLVVAYLSSDNSNVLTDTVARALTAQPSGVADWSLEVTRQRTDPIAVTGIVPVLDRLLTATVDGGVQITVSNQAF